MRMKYDNKFKTVLVTLLAGLALSAGAADSRLVKLPVHKPCISLFPLSDVRLHESEFKKIQDLNHQYLLSLEPDRLLSWFRREAGLTSKAPAYPFWESEDVWGGGPLSGHILGFYLSSMSMMYESTGDEEIKKKLAYAISELKECQETYGDGYALATINGRRIFDDLARGDFRSDKATINGAWEPIYILNKIMLGLYNAYLSCDMPLAKEVLVNMADWFGYKVLDHLTHDQIQKILECEHGSINESFVDVYSITGDEKYLKWATRLNDEDMLLPASRQQDVLNGWHANTQIPKFTGFERIFTYTQDKECTDAARFFWETVVGKHTWIIGGNSTGEHFFPVDEFEKRLPQIGGPESCNSVNMMRLTEALYSDYAGMDKVDYYERVLFNHILANYDPHEGMCTYYTSMRPGHYKIYGTKYHSFWCCTGTGMEAPAKFGKMIYARDPSGLYVNMFIASEVNWKEKGVKLVQQTAFPDRNTVEFTVHTAQSQRFALHIRRPYWNEGKKLHLRVNGKSMSLPADANGYVELDRVWTDGDKILLELQPRLTVEYLKGSTRYAASMYGPIVLAARVDNVGLQECNFRSARRTVASQELPMLKAPALIGNLKDIARGISKQEGTDKLTLKCSSKVASREFELVPFNRIHFNRYAVYFPLYAQRKDYLAEYDKVKGAIREEERLQQLTVDRVMLECPDSEKAHHLDGVNTSNGENHGQTWRHATGGGYFMYRLAVLPAGKQFLCLKFVRTDEGKRVFDILVDGHAVATLDHSTPKESPTLFYRELIPIPEQLTRNKHAVTVKLQARKDNIAGGVFDVRVVREE